MKLQLSRSRRRALDGAFRLPAARDPDERDVRSMLGALAEAMETKVTENELLARAWDFYSVIAQSRTTCSSQRSP